MKQKKGTHKVFKFMALVLFFSVLVTSGGQANEAQFGLKLDIKGLMVTLSWDRMEGADHYSLFYASYPDPTAESIVQIPMGNKTTVTSKLWKGAAYYVAIRAENAAGPVAFTNVENFVVSEDTPETPAGLNPFASDTELLDYLKKGLTQNAVLRNQMPYMMMDGVAAPMATDANAETTSNVGASADKTFSTTNIQEKGVDEADTIKTDGEYLYVIPQGDDYVYSTYYFAEPIKEEDGAAQTKEITVYKLMDDPAKNERIAGIPLTTHKNKVEGLYLLENRGDDQSDLLVTIGGQAQNYWVSWADPWFWMRGTTEVALYNVDDPQNAKQTTLLSIDGQLISSRVVGDTLYLVTRFTPSLPDFNPYPMDKEEEAKNEALLEKINLADLVPGFTVDGTVQEGLIEPARCFLPPSGDDIAPQPTLISVTAIRLSDPKNPIVQTIAGPTETLYMSTEALYLATTQYHYARPMPLMVEDVAMVKEAVDEKVAADIYEPTPVTTDLHKFLLTEEGPQYRGSGSVLGHLGWEEDKKSFRLSDYKGVLRIATSIGETWDDTATTRLTLLREASAEDENGRLEEISFIDGIGHVGEKLYAVRYVGPRAYLVTFRVTDPLYVFDLSDPENPQMQGELHIDGYSDYLHPIGENLLLGIGKDALPDEASNDFGGRGAWYQGVKLSLFDVTDPANPKEIKSLIYGKRGTQSDVLYDHHALAYIPPHDNQPARLALPVNLNETVPTGSWFEPEKPWSYYEWTHTGLYMFEIHDGTTAGTPADLEKVGELIVESAENNNATWTYGTDRAVLLNDSVHYVHGTNVFSTAWATQNDRSAPDIVVGNADSGRTVVVPKGGKLQVKLTSNQTTGYRWVIASMDKSLVQLISNTYQADCDYRDVTIEFDRIASVPEDTASSTVSDGASEETSGNETGATTEPSEAKEPAIEPLDFIAPDTGDGMIVGCGGEEIWNFQALKSGVTTLKMQYARPWEPEVTPQDTFSLTIEVQ